MSDSFSHLDSKGQPQMVDVSGKSVTERSARARSLVFLGKEIMKNLAGGELLAPKGPVFQTAILAGTLAAKKTGDLIPLCHPLGLESITFDIQPIDDERVAVECRVSMSGKTGVEMEALTGVTLAALTIYDMCKAMSHDIRITETVLMEKSGGKRDFRRAN